MGEMISIVIGGQPTLVELPEPTHADVVLEGLALRRTQALDPALPPTPLARLAGECLRRLEPRWPDILGFAVATSDMPVGHRRADIGRTLAPRWALLAHGCASAVSCFGTTPDAPESLDETHVLDASRAAVALAALAAGHDTIGAVSSEMVVESLERLAAEEQLPASIRYAARHVARGLLQAGSRAEERELLFALQLGVSGCPQPVSGELLPPERTEVIQAAVTPSALAAACNTTILRNTTTNIGESIERAVGTEPLPLTGQAASSGSPPPAAPVSSSSSSVQRDRLVSMDPRTRQVLVDGVPLESTSAVSGDVNTSVLTKLLSVRSGSGYVGSKALAAGTGHNTASVRRSYGQLRKTLLVSGQPLLGSERGVYGLAPGFVSVAVRP